MKNHRPAPPKFSFVNLVNVLISKIMYTNFTAGRFKKKYHPISTNPKIGVRGGVKLLPTVKRESRR